MIFLNSGVHVVWADMFWKTEMFWKAKMFWKAEMNSKAQMVLEARYLERLNAAFFFLQNIH
jgi:hypothetical protein